MADVKKPVSDTLFGFQKEDVEFLGTKRGVLVANEMGTGKTYEAIARDQLLRAESDWPDKRTLVIAPLSVHGSWEEHFSTLTDLTVKAVNPKNRDAIFDGDPDVLIVHWEGIRLMDGLKKMYFLHIIADECHKAKNRKAQQTRALKQLKAYARTAMSGTPVVNRPDELWSILNWLYPDEYKSYWRFYKQHVDYEIIYPQGYHKVTGPKNEELLRERMSPFFVRRLKEDVLPDLPDKYYTPLWVELTPAQRRAYNAMKKEMVAWIGAHEDTPLVAPVVIAQLTRLQQFAVAYAEFDDGKVTLAEPSSKLDALINILTDEPGPTVVFSQFKQLIRVVNARLEKEGISYISLTGDTPQSQRGDLVSYFQQPEGPTVFSGTIGAGGVGITLTRASRVVFLDRTWSPALNQQAEDRLHRIGQESAVQVIDIMATNTVDLGRKQRLETKWSWIKALLGDE